MNDLAPPFVLAVNGISPRIAPDVFIAPGAVVVGDVEIGPGSSVWFNAVIRGDVAPVRIGARTNVQDGAVLHVDPNAPCIVGDDVTIGHRAVVHGTTVGNGVTVGMGSIVLSRSKVGDRAIVAAGAVVAEDAVVAPGALVMGVPAKERRILEEERQLASVANATGYVANAGRFKKTLADIGAAWRSKQMGDDDDGG
ncbi:MAG TPA: gamma carbonic anhydrase family protein [Thermomicrobiales bacterium]|jgi:carbonic anhydrase/acetyltransferase-like protein (isoleucine patch superfamily)